MKINSINNSMAVSFKGAPKKIAKIAKTISSFYNNGAKKSCESFYPNGLVFKKVSYYPVQQAKISGAIAEGKKFNPNGTVKFEIINPVNDPYAIARQYDNNGFLKREKFIHKSPEAASNLKSNQM